MNSAWIETIALILIIIGSFLIFLFHDWRVRIGLLAILYAASTMLVGVTISINVSITMLVSGWISGAVLGMALVSSVPRSQRDRESVEQTSRSQINRRRVLAHPFRLPATILVLLVTISIAPQFNSLIPGVSILFVTSSLVLMGMGILMLGLNTRPFPTILGLLMVMAGFQTVYFAIEASILVAGLLSAITLGLSVAGAYLLISPELVDTE